MTATNTALATTNSTVERAITLLGSGTPPVAVASALGVTEGYISQLVADEAIATRVTQLRYESLRKHSARDTSYDEMEDALLEKLRDLLPLMMRPAEILAAIKIVNGAKRRGQSSPESLTNKQEIVQLVLPTHIVQHFQVDIKNSVIKTGERELLTITPKTLEGIVAAKGVTHDVIEAREESARSRIAPPAVVSQP